MSKHITLENLNVALPPIKHLIDKKAEGVDWNENDPAASGYIRNRTHYKGIYYETILPATDIVFEENWGDFEYDTEVSYTLINGETYLINFDGTEYNCVASEVNIDGFVSYVLGNLYLVGISDINTGEPFFIAVNNSYISCCISYDESTTLSVGISGNVQIIHKIPEEYLPKIVGTFGVGLNAEVFNSGAPSQASGEFSHAEGCATTASGNSAHAEGNGTTASGSFAHAEGLITVASGGYAHAEGSATTASGLSAHAEGNSTTASGSHAHAEGNSTTASGSSAHTEGYKTRAGNETIVTNVINSTSYAYGHAEGYSTLAKGTAAHAEGQCSTASARSSHAEGERTTASGLGSHAEGMGTFVEGAYAHAEGYWTNAISDYQHVQGKYNIDDNSAVYAHIVGNGTSVSKRSNAHTLDWDGLGWFAGGLKVGGTGQDDTAAVEVALKTDIVAITTDEIDAICGTTIYTSEEVEL